MLDLLLQTRLQRDEVILATLAQVILGEPLLDEQRIQLAEFLRDLLIELDPAKADEINAGLAPILSTRKD